MFDPVDYSTNQFFKLSESPVDFPSRYYGFNFGRYVIFIKSVTRFL